MAEGATITDLQYKIAQLFKEVDRYRNNEAKDHSKNQGNINVSDDRIYRLEAVSSVLDNLRNEFEAIKLSSESNPQSHSCADQMEKDVSDSDTSTDISSLKSTFSSSIGSSSIATDSDTKTETQSNQDPNEVETFVITLKGKSKLPSFTQLLPNVFSRALQAESLTKGTSTETIQQSLSETQTNFTQIGAIDKESSCELYSSVIKVVSTQTNTNISSNSSLEKLRNLGLHESIDPAKYVRVLREKAQLQPFTEILPVIIDVMQILPTAEIQLECIQLIQSSLFEQKFLFDKSLFELTCELKANLVETILTCLRSNINDELIVDCCTDLLNNLDIFADPIDKYVKTVEIHLKIISNAEMTTTTRNDTIWLLIEIIKKSDENRRILVGLMGGVEQICEVIRQQLNNTTYDRILINSWNCLVNLCAESLENYKKFLSAGGVDLFHLCYEQFGDERKMIEVMMLMMSNLSCESFLRKQRQLFKQDFDVFWKILLKFNGNLASWYCVRFLDNFLTDLTIIWPLNSLSTVEETKNLLIETVNKWKLDGQLNAQENTFKTLLDELRLHRSPLTDLLYSWRIANLTTVYPPKYCRLLRDEGGVEIITTEVIRHSNSSLDAIRLTIVTLDNVKRWESTANQQ